MQRLSSYISVDFFGSPSCAPTTAVRTTQRRSADTADHPSDRPNQTQEDKRELTADSPSSAQTDEPRVAKPQHPTELNYKGSLHNNWELHTRRRIESMHNLPTRRQTAADSDDVRDATTDREWSNKSADWEMGRRIEEKMMILHDYLFLLAFENTEREESYVTEKVYTALLAGAVPVYWGAPVRVVFRSSLLSFQFFSLRLCLLLRFEDHACMHNNIIYASNKK